LEPGWEFSASHDPATGELTVLSLNDATALPPFVDTNANGLPDAWEIEHFMMLGAEPGADPDSDGLTNLLEYATGSNPVAFNQGPAIEASPQGVGGLFDYVLLVDPTARGVRLVLETSRDLEGWAKQGPTIRPATTRLAPGPFGSGVTLVSDNILPADGLRQLRFRLSSPATEDCFFLRFNTQSESP
jgi:hypothetical protein